MDGTRIVRFRWRLRGAWMWPSFVALTILDGFLIHWRPPLGDSASPIAGWLIGTFVSIAAFVVLAPLVAIPLRRVRSDMPRVVARDYAGVVTTSLVTVAILTAGLVHHTTVTADRAALRDAVARAEAYIGDHAPARFRRNLADINTYELQPPLIYRSCVTAPGPGGTSSYCVVVDRSKPFPGGVRYAGSEPNGVISQGTS